MSKEETQPEANNNLHVCNETKAKLEKVGKSLMDSSLSSDEIALIWDFYVSHAPVRKDADDKGNGGGLRYLGEYGWKGNKELTALERKMIMEATLGRIVIIKADELTETLASMNLGREEEICWNHPRAVVQQSFSVNVKENGECKINEKEKRMACFFLHIRNALAHNRIYYSPDGRMILLEDIDNKKITARILIPTIALINWIRVIDKDRIFYFKTNAENEEDISESVVAS